MSHAVRVVRGTEAEGYPFLDHPFTITVLSCAAVKHPVLTEDREYRYAAHQSLMSDKIDVILAAARKTGCSAVVLSAFGCGAFGNPPDVVARLFAESIAVFGGFEQQEIVFCIQNDHNTGHSHNPNGNFIPFRNALDSDFRGQRGSPSRALLDQERPDLALLDAGRDVPSAQIGAAAVSVGPAVGSQGSQITLSVRAFGRTLKLPVGMKEGDPSNMTAVESSSPI